MKFFAVRTANVFESNRFNRLSDWRKAKKAVAYCLLYKRKLQSIMPAKDDGCHSPEMKVDTDLLLEAEKEIIKSVQHEAFGDYMGSLSKVSPCPKNFKGTKCKGAQLYKLAPYIIDDGIIRVGGQIDDTDFLEELKHPIILPKKVMYPCLLQDIFMKKHAIKVVA